MQHEIICAIQDEAAIPKRGILLDSQSTVYLFLNEKLLTSIRDAKRNLVLFCNSGKAIVTKKGNVKGYGTVWFHPVGIARFLSLSNVQKKQKVMCNNTLNKDFLLHKADSTIQVIRITGEGEFFSCQFE